MTTGLFPPNSEKGKHFVLDPRLKDALETKAII